MVMNQDQLLIIFMFILFLELKKILKMEMRFIIKIINFDDEFYKSFQGFFNDKSKKLEFKEIIKNFNNFFNLLFKILSFF